MQTLIDYGAAALTWTVVASLGISAFKELGDRRVTQTWLLTLLISLMATFQVDAIYVAVDDLLGVNNLSWLLSYLSLTLAVYLLGSIFDVLSRWLYLYTIATVILLVAIFPFGPGSTAEITDHIVPSNVSELSFTGLAYSYAVVVMVAILSSCVRALCNESEIYARLRTYVVSSTLVVSILFYATKFVAYTSGFFFPSPLLHAATNTAKVLVAGVSILWFLIFATNRFYLALARPVEFAKKLKLCKELGELQVWLDGLCPSPFSDQAPWWEWLRDPDYHVYRRVISILDRKKALAAWIEQPDQETSGTFTLSIEEATRLYRGLASIPESSGFDHVTDTCHRLSRQIIRGVP
jgi:hypothetical protein